MSRAKRYAPHRQEIHSMSFGRFRDQTVDQYAIKARLLKLTSESRQVLSPAVTVSKDVTFWKRFMPPLSRLLGVLFLGLLMVH